MFRTSIPSAATAFLLLVTGTGACRQNAQQTQAYMDEARVLLNQSRLEEAQAMSELSVEQTPTPRRDALELLAQIYRAQATHQIENGQWEEGCQRTLAAASIEPGRARQLRDYLEALEHCQNANLTTAQLADVAEKASHTDPTSVSARRQAANLWDEAGELDRSVPHYLWLWEADRSQTQVGLRLGTVYATLERFDDAQVILQRVLESDPANVQAALNLAEALEGTGQHQGAYMTYEKLLKDFPENAGILLRFAGFLERRGDGSSADALRRRASQAMPGVEKRNLRPLR